jgi:phosphoglycerate dehydrogenase-like enzyme
MMTGSDPVPSVRKKVGLACDEDTFHRYIDPADVARLEAVADFCYRSFSGTSSLEGPARRDPDAERDLAEFAAPLDALIVCHGAPLVSAEVMARAPNLILLGELEGDRFGYHLDLGEARARGIRVVDTTHGSSWPTAEWALALALVGLRNAGYYFRRLAAHQPAFAGGKRPRSGRGYDAAELSGRRVGMIGFGRLAWRLTDLLRPFRVDIVTFDPFASRDLAEAYGVAFGPLEAVLDRDVVFCLVPLTPLTRGMLGAPELKRLRPGSVFVNVSRGQVVDSAALLSRLHQGDVLACLDVFDPEPIPAESPLLDLANVFLSPHIGGVTEESRRRFFSLMVDECVRVFEGLEPRHELAPDVVRLRTTGTVAEPEAATPPPTRAT